MNLAELSVKRPVTTLMILVSMVALGLISYPRVPLMFLPDTSFPMVNINVPYASSSPEEVERLITRPLEDALGTLSHLKRLGSTSGSSNARVSLEFESGTDMDLASMEVRDRLDQVRGELPADVDRIRIWQFNPNDRPIFSFSVAWGGDPAEFYDIVTKVIQPRVQRVEGVANVEFRGMTEKQLLVEVDQEALKAHNLDLFNVSQVLTQNNVTLAAGSVTDGGRKYNVRAVGEFRTVDEIYHLPIPGTTLTLSDVADVRYDYPERRNFQRLNGVNAVTMEVYKASVANIVDVATGVRAVLDELKAQPQFAQLQTRIFRDQSEDIINRLADLRNAGLIGGALAVLVLFLFLRNVRSTFIISLAMPISIIFTFTFMYLLIRLFGSSISLNIISLMGLMLAVGMLVDSAVVVLESIYRHRQETDMPAVMAAIVGSREVHTALVASTATTLCVFIPLIFMEAGGMMQMMRDFAIAFCIVMVAALFVSLTLIPLMSSRLFAKPIGAPSKTIQRVIHAYGRVLGWNLRHRVVTLLIVAGVFYGSYWMYNHIEREFVPPSPTNDVVIDAEVPGSFSLQDVEKLFADVEKTLLARKDEFHIETVSTNGSLRRATLHVVLTPPETRDESATELQEKIKAALPEVAGVQWKPARLRWHGGGEGGISVELRGDNMDVLATLAQDIRRRMEAIPGLKDVDTSLERGDEEIQVQVNRAMAQTYGITPQQAARTVQTALSDRPRGRFKADDREVDILLQLEKEDRKNLDQLRNMTFERTAGGLIPLGSLASFDIQRGPEAIQREDRKSIVTIGGNTDIRGMQTLSARVSQMMAGMELPPGYSWSLGRNFRQMREAEQGSSFALILSVILIYLIMAALFESFIHPFTIMFSIPFSFIGVGIVFYLTNTTLSTMSYIGLIVLAGLVVNNAIVMIDHINHLRREGMPRREAIIRGSMNRFRPILMTALTTIFGLLPMVAPAIAPQWFGPVEDRGASFWTPVSMALVGGLTTSGFLTLIILPTIYSFMDDLGGWARRVVRAV